MKPDINPEPFAVDAVLEQMEWDEQKERTREALAAFHRREAKVPVNRKVLWGLFWFCFGATLALLWLAGWFLP